MIFFYLCVDKNESYTVIINDGVCGMSYTLLIKSWVISYKYLHFWGNIIGKIEKLFYTHKQGNKNLLV